MKKFLTLSLLVVANIGITHCKTQAEQRIVESFNKVHIEGPGSLFIVQNEEESFFIETDENNLSKIESSVSNGILYLKSNCSSGEKIQYKIAAKDISEIVVAQPTFLEIKNFEINHPLEIKMDPQKTGFFFFSLKKSSLRNVSQELSGRYACFKPLIPGFSLKINLLTAEFYDVLELFDASKIYEIIKENPVRTTVISCILLAGLFSQFKRF